MWSTVNSSSAPHFTHLKSSRFQTSKRFEADIDFLDGGFARAGFCHVRYSPERW
jgi:hypothetical protein